MCAICLLFHLDIILQVLETHPVWFSIRYTYEVAPVFTVMEEAVLRKMIGIVGWEEGGDGLFSPGSTEQQIWCLLSVSVLAV